MIRSIAGIARSKNRSGCPRSDFLEGAAPSVSPFSSARIVPEVITPLKLFATSKTMWTLPPLWTHRTRPQGFGNLAKNARFPQRPHRSSFSLKKKNEEQNHSDQLSTENHPHRESGGANLQALTSSAVVSAYAMCLDNPLTRTQEAVDAAAAVDAQNASTAAWKSR